MKRWRQCLLIGGLSCLGATAMADGIAIDADNPRFWSYDGTRVILLGGSVEDNLFQIDDLEAHLDLLVASGGNYVRNTMSSRDAGNRWPYRQGYSTDGRPADALGGWGRFTDRLADWREDRKSVYPKYDLEAFDDEYWARFERLLQLTEARDIVVQIEIWDRFDYARDPWLRNPFNPANNINYSVSESRLLTRYPQHPGHNHNGFFRTMPELLMNPRLLRYQQALVDQLLSISLKYDNVLYTISNETSGDEIWSTYWAEYVRARANDAGKTIFITEMWDAWNLDAPVHRRTTDHPERYDFLDVSQNNHQVGQLHWDRLVAQWRRLIAMPRPMNNVKVYGADGGRFKSTDVAINRFWRALLGGSAAVRFHRSEQNFGLGLTREAQRQLQSARALTQMVDLTRLTPRQDWLIDRAPNEAFATSDGIGTHVVFFPDGGDVAIPSDQSGPLDARWLRVDETSVSQTTLYAETGRIRVTTPADDGRWVLVVSDRFVTESQ